MTSARYDSKYFQIKDAAERRSAEVIVPLVLALLEPHSVCDVGCSHGAWLAVFKIHGVGKVLGIDGEYVEREKLKIDPEEFLAADLEDGVPAADGFDLAVSLEVAEHLREQAAAGFVEGLVALAPAVLFSAAVPGQGGRGHANEQWPEYWRALFEQHGYVPIDCIRPSVWNLPDVNVWYRQNAILFAHRSLVESRPRLREAYERSVDRPLSLVHPLILEAALERPWKLFRELIAEVEAGRLTHEELEARMARLLERFAERARDRSVRPADA